jgi:hypothetical protein
MMLRRSRGAGEEPSPRSQSTTSQHLVPYTPCIRHNQSSTSSDHPVRPREQIGTTSHNLTAWVEKRL